MPVMRVLVDGLAFGMAAVGGVRRVFAELLPRLAADPSLDVVLALRARGGEAPPDWPGVRRAGYLLLPAPFASRSPLRRLVDGAIRPLERAWLRLRTGRPDLLHPTYYTPPLLAGAPTVVTVYDLIHRRFPEFYPTAEDDRFREAQAAVIRAASHVVCISEATRRDVVELLGIPPERTTVTPLAASLQVPAPGRAGAASDDSQPATLPSAEGAVLHVGMRAKYKNVPALLRAMRVRPELRGVELVLAGGEPDWLPEERPLVEGLRVRRLGRVTDAELAALYASAGVTVCASLCEGFGLPVLEAMAAGGVVAASRAGSLPEVGGDAAAYFDPRDAESIADALLRGLSLSAAERNAKAAAGRARAAGFTWDRTAALTREVWRRVAGS